MPPEGVLPRMETTVGGEAAETDDKETRMAEPSAATKLTQYLNEAYGLEQKLETSLQAHIAMTEDAPYKKRLKEHLAETKRHSREVKKRIKALGGVPATIDPPGPDVVGDAAQAVLGGAQKVIALAQGPLHAIRGTGQEEKHLKNVKTEYASESEEIATYTGIHALAEALGDKDTQRLAREILREEERMRSYLEKQIPRFTKAVAKAEVPASQRAKASSTRKAGSRKPASSTRKPAAERTRKPASRTKRSPATAGTAAGGARRR
jgi:ferritin-like metal-binding protein YciE